MLAKLLIANRGEIACRIIRTARRLGVRTVLAVSDADRRSLAASQADEVAPIGPAPASESYLRADHIIDAARRAGCDAIHPGYGFLSENADFAEAVTAAGLIFVGPTPAAMRALGGKSAAKKLAIASGVPVVPGYQDEAQDDATLASAAARIGWPVMIKAVNGGGGRGMRMVERAADFADAVTGARREAMAAFGSDAMLIEKLIVRPRHVEVQVFGDAHGNVVHLFERDCSLQRRNQKVIEEAPAPGMSPELRGKMTEAAVRLAKSVDYRNAGTVEFLIEGRSGEGGTLGADAARWYFIEMNTRLQVEHPVTEAITGLDLVEWQLRVASGEPLPLRQDEIAMRGHAIEVRLNAEDPASGFLPSVGRLIAFQHDPLEATTRLETGVRTGDEITPHYDSMIAKLICRGTNRTEAIAFVLHELAKLRIAGPQTNIRFLASLLEDQDVATGRVDTGLIGRGIERLTDQAIDRRAMIGALETLILDRARLPHAVAATNTSIWTDDPWLRNDAFTLGPPRRTHMQFMIGGQSRQVDVSWHANADRDHSTLQWAPRIEPVGWTAAEAPANAAALAGALLPDGSDGYILIDRGVQTHVAYPTWDANGEDEPAGDRIRAPINGRVAKLSVTAGAVVEKGQPVAVIEAMKMEHVLLAPRAGVIAAVAVAEGAQVASGDLIASLEEAQP